MSQECADESVPSPAGLSCLLTGLRHVLVVQKPLHLPVGSDYLVTLVGT